MGWTTSLLLLSLLGLSACQQRSLRNTGNGRQRLQSGKPAEVADFNCPQDFGYYPHPTDCTQYYVCVFGGALQESCTGGLVYSHELETCDWPRNVDCAPGATGGGVSTIIVTDPRTRSSNTRPISPVTESLTPSVGSFDKFDHSFSSTKNHRTTQTLNGADRSGNERALFRQPSSKSQFLSSHFSSSSFFNAPGTGGTNNRRPTKSASFTPSPVVVSHGPSAPARLPSSVDQTYFSDFNYTDPDYYFYYDDLLYDYYDVPGATPTQAPARHPAPTQPAIRTRVAPSTSSKSFGRSGSTSRGRASSSRATTSPSQSFQAAPAAPRLRSPSSSSSPARDAIAQLFDFSLPDFDPSSPFPFSSLQPSAFNQNPAPSPSRPASRPVPQTRPQIVSAPAKKPQIRVPTRERTPTHAIRSQSRPSSSLSALKRPIPSEFPSFPVPSSSSSSSGSHSPSTAQRIPSRPSSSSTRSSSSSNSRPQPTPSGPPAVDNSQPKRSRRPTLKPVSVLAPSAPTASIDIWRYPPRRPTPTRPHPTPDTKATKCDPKVCRLPDCYCGGGDIPGGFSAAETPQLVLLTFDDSVNDLNKDLYTDLFEKGRLNPNGCPILSTMYVSHEWTDYSQVQNLYAEGHEIASHSITHSFGEQFSTTKWAKEIAGQREILSAYGGVKMEDVRGMRAPFLAVGGNKMYRMLYEQNFTYDSSMPVYENNPPSWPYTLDYRLFHDCMIPPCPTNSFPGLWQVPMVMWQDLKGGRCSMGDACTTPPDAEGVYKMLIKNFERHYTTNRAPFGLFYHAAWFTTPHHKEGFIAFLDTITAMDDVWLVTNWQALQWVRDPTPLSRVKSFGPFQCNYSDRPKCTTKKVCNVWHKGGVRYMRTCQKCPDEYPWTGNTGVKSPLNDLP
ncbi:uncharacterized protein LOC135100273 isoform X6 [Scylla paramamosain]|uniref:uncharacterized protein LOC135100273 isoform X6 n=1 Tax=Scylla paramamosain TaxID=85552 RepID=UPI0030830EE6